MAIIRIRRSIQQIQNDYDNGDQTELLNLIKAWRGIKDLPPDDPNSFFRLGGYHGEPFRGPGVTDPEWWGGYCNHGNVLFPTWHRAYLFKLEDALRSIPGCEDVTLPYWDETLDEEAPLPDVLTSPTFPLVGGQANPLYSYALQETLVHNVDGANHRYTKHKGYSTVRFPQSGLVGTAEDRENTEKHNEVYSNSDTNIEMLKANVKAWLNGTVEIPDDGSGARIPDTYSVRARWQVCLEAPNYTVFSNTTSQNQWISDFGPQDPHYVVSVESPHNAIHLAIGGFYQYAVYNASPIIGANGDMGDNETAGFDPIFYFHHCFVDYAFWVWQQRNQKTTRGSLDVIPFYPGTIVPEGEASPYLPPGTKLDMDTSLYPFRHANQLYVTSNDVTDILEMGYNYGPGSLDPRLHTPLYRLPEIQEKIVAYKRIHNINRTRYAGSFVIRTFASFEDKKVEIGHEPILSRRNIEACANCQNKLEVESLVPIYRGQLEAIFGEKNLPDVKFHVEIHTHDALSKGGLGAGDEPKLGDLWPGH